MKNLLKIVLFNLFIVLTLATLTACGGGGSSDAPSQPVGSTQSAAKASDFSGTWTGFTQTNTIISMPFTFNVSSATDTTATVTFASAEASGTGSATFNTTTGDLSFNFVPPSGTSTIYSGVISKMGSTLTLKSLTGGSITYGTGSCTPQALGSTLDLSGVWTGTSTYTTVGSSAPPTPGGNITMTLAADGFGGYVGMLVDSTGAYNGQITANNGAAWGSPTVWQYRLISASGTTTVLNMVGGFDTRTTTFRTDGTVDGGLNMILSGYTIVTGPGVTASLGLTLQRSVSPLLAAIGTINTIIVDTLQNISNSN